MDRERWFDCYYEDVVLLNYNDEKRRAHLKYESLPKVTLKSLGPPFWASSYKMLKQQSYTSRKPVIPSALADTLCADLTVEIFLALLNIILGTSYTLCTVGIHSVLGDCIQKKYDFGTAYTHIHPFWYGDLTTLVDDLSECKVQYQQMLEDIPVNDRIIYPCVAPHTSINGHQWHVPISEDTSLERIWIEMLNLGAEYVWLDVLCLRQDGGLMKDLHMGEWKVDVPTTGSVYAGADKVVCYLHGLGRSWTSKLPCSEDDWFKCAWTLQEISKHLIIGGDSDTTWECMN
ncbi:hypothetical protein IW262DRAFT_1462748 [Armillaria fumosa]|nr:hypothetical protein IW262DRAFT_1462748 [Armillaria fumosa]